jgi:hypothetical protein
MSDYKKLSDIIKDIPNKIYQMTYNKDKKIFELVYIGNDDNIRYHCGLNFKFECYKILCVTYSISECELIIDNKYFKIIGLLFTKEGKTYYSLDIVKYKSEECAKVILNKHNINDDKNDIIESKIIEKIENYPDDKKVIEYLISLLNHNEIEHIYE